jgi:L-lactate dehydrogenase complex protein LldF
VLVDQRAQVVDAHRTAGRWSRLKPEAMAMRVASFGLSDPRRAAAGERAARLGLRAARRWSALPGLRAWTSARDLPPAPPESFRAWWKRTDGGRRGDES